MTETFKSSDIQPQDYATRIQLGRTVVHAAQFQGRREFQEDQIGAAAGIVVGPEDARDFVVGAIHRATDAARKYKSQGSTVAAVFVTENKMLYAAGLGDSTVSMMVIDRAAGRVVEVRCLTREHTLNDPDEMKRVLGKTPFDPAAPVIVTASGATILRRPRGYKLCSESGGSLAISKAAGDRDVAGVSDRLDPVKDVAVVDLNPILDAGYEVIPLVESDGNGARLLPGDRVRAVESALAQDPHVNIAAVLSHFAIRAGSTDNCSAVATRITREQDENVSLYLGDAHGSYIRNNRGGYDMPFGLSAASRDIVGSLEASAKSGMDLALRHFARLTEEPLEEPGPETVNMPRRGALTQPMGQHPGVPSTVTDIPPLPFGHAVSRPPSPTVIDPALQGPPAPTVIDEPAPVTRRTPVPPSSNR